MIVLKVRIYCFFFKIHEQNFDFRHFALRLAMLSFKLSNMRNQEERYICFINAVLQFLAAIPVIRRFFHNKAYQQFRGRNHRICSEITRIFSMAGSQAATSAGALRQEERAS